MKKRYTVIVVVLVLVCIVFVVVASGLFDSISPQESAWTACTMFINRELGISHLDADNYDPGGVTDLGGGLYKITIYYAAISSIYHCEILHINENWELQSLKQIQ